MSGAAPSADRALQAERTSLAWTRTSLGFLANGGLLLLKNVRMDVPRVSLIVAGFTVVMTLWVYIVGRRRQKLLARQPLPANLAPRREVYAVTSLVAVLICVSLLSLLI